MDGGYVIGTERGVLFGDNGLKTFRPFVELIDQPNLRTNDGGCDPLGSIVIGTMAYDESPDMGAVYRISPDGSVKVILKPVTISNGVQWSSDGSRVFYIDSGSRRVDVFDFDKHSGLWSDRRTHISFGNADGVPDGMAIDEDDGLWIALWGGSAVHYYDKNGFLVDKIGVPGVSQVSSCAFGGEGLKTLFITTSRKGLPGTAEPAAGAIFSIPSVQGAKQAEFVG